MNLQNYSVENLKRQATRLKKATGIPHHEALDQVCKQNGYANWRHFLNLQATRGSSASSGELASYSLRCPNCENETLEVRAVVTEMGSVPMVLHRWMPVEKATDGTTLSGFAQVWGERSEMRCKRCNFEDTASAFGFEGADVHLNPLPADAGLQPQGPFLHATARVENDIVVYTQEPYIKDRRLRPAEVERQLRANGAFKENIERFMQALQTTGIAQIYQRQAVYKFFA
jgi:hypothetical protein